MSHLDPPATLDVPRPPERLQRRLRPAGRAWFGRRYDVRIHHADRVPATGPQVVAVNHLGWLDGPLLVACHPRPVHALTKAEMFTGRLGAFLHAVGQIPLDRAEIDPAAIRSCLRVLRDGGVVGIFPEGTRGGGDLRRTRSGAAYLAAVTGARIVPLAVLGTRVPGGASESRPPAGSRIDLVYGEAFETRRLDFPRRQHDVRQVRNEVHQRLRSHLEEAVAMTGQSLPGPIPPIAPTPPSAPSVSPQSHRSSAGEIDV